MNAAKRLHRALSGTFSSWRMAIPWPGVLFRNHARLAKLRFTGGVFGGWQTLPPKRKTRLGTGSELNYCHTNRNADAEGLAPCRIPVEMAKSLSPSRHCGSLAYPGAVWRRQPRLTTGADAEVRRRLGLSPAMVAAFFRGASRRWQAW